MYEASVDKLAEECEAHIFTRFPFQRGYSSPGPSHLFGIIATIHLLQLFSIFFDALLNRFRHILHLLRLLATQCAIASARSG